MENVIRLKEPIKSRRSSRMEVRATDGGFYDISFSSEAPVQRYDYETGAMVDEILIHEAGSMDLGPLLEVGSILKNHNPDMIVGAPVNAALDVEARRGRAQIRFGNSQLAKDTKQEVDDGSLRGVSFGYEILSILRVAAGEVAQYGGRKFKGPALLGVKWRVHELSLTPIPADVTVGVGRSKEDLEKEGQTVAKNSQTRQDEETTPPAEDEKTKQEEDAAQALADAEKKVAEAKEEAKQELKEELMSVLGGKSKECSGDEKKSLDADAIRAEERNRVQGIYDRCKKAGMDEKFARNLIQKGYDERKACMAIVDAMEQRDRPAARPGDGISTGEDATDKWARDVEVNLHRNLGAQYWTPEVAKRDDDYPNSPMRLAPYYEKAKDVDRRFVRLSDIGYEYLERVGIHNARRMSRENMARMLFSRKLYERASSSSMVTGNLSNLLSNVAFKVLIGRYRKATPTWKYWCRTGSIPDFKANDRVRMSDMPNFRPTGENGELLGAVLSDEKETARLAMYGRIISFTYEMFINDDLDALSRMPAMLGSGAINLVSRLVYTALLANGTLQDGTALFASGHGNYDSTASALAAARLAVAIKNMRKQTGVANPSDTSEYGAEPLDIQPKGLLVPPELEVTAKQLAFSPGSVEQYMSGEIINIFRDIVREVVVEARLSQTGFHSSISTTGWYLYGDPTENDTFEVGFLEGNQDPRVDTEEMFERLAVQMRAYLPVSVTPLDYRALHMSVGA